MLIQIVLLVLMWGPIVAAVYTLMAEYGGVGLIYAFFALQLTIFVHEAGHAVACRMMGGWITQFRIGVPIRLEFNIAGVRVGLGLIPLRGSVSYNSNAMPLKQRTIITAAGPLANVLLCFSCVWIDARWSGALMLMSLSEFIFAVLPFKTQDMLRSDGYKILRAYRYWRRFERKKKAPAPVAA